MSEPTKACNLTENELKQLIIWHGYNLNDEGRDDTAIENMADRIERINYLNKRLKAFSEPAADVTSTNTAAGWGNPND